MPATRTDLALAAGLTASAATLGVLVALGRATADPFVALIAGGHLWLGHLVRPEWPYVVVGAMRHVALVTPLGFAVAATEGTRANAGLVALAVGALVVLLGPWFPDVLRPLALDLAPAERVVTWLALAGGLVLGARLVPERTP